MDIEANRKTLNMEPSESQPVLCPNAIIPKLNLGEQRPLITEPITIPIRKGKTTPCSSPMSTGSPGSAFGNMIPSPIITKRTRTSSQYNRAMENPVDKGKIKCFSRSKGHGFVVSDRGGEDIFLHISDIEGEYCPKEGDEVSYRLCAIPPKNEKFQAVHVHIINFTPDVHLKWETPLDDEEKKEDSPNYLVT